MSKRNGIAQDLEDQACIYHVFPTGILGGELGIRDVAARNCTSGVFSLSGPFSANPILLAGLFDTKFRAGGHKPSNRLSLINDPTFCTKTTYTDLRKSYHYISNH